ncbi:DUF6513 domain-containing protein [Caldinitratiruptor microaerophilus]|uniref:Dihydropteroate synthase n=1 Tax=Caldinitratiruptor microaerophilus TaxID=671077 RepID=A0AA35CNA8_9FIRM|nr:DUF6513 domain-containing protein [Caldinitratiruptor microaerophilus]BDG60445.1 dihydropteroate synthase [Caldinitratiruptor microaerophilus]
MQRILCVTGTLAERALRATLADLAGEAEWEVQVLPITVASLMTTEWMAPRLTVPPGTDRVLIPGLCRGDVGALSARLGVPVERGPADLKDLPEFFGRRRRLVGYGEYSALLFAEVQSAPELPWERLLAQAEYYRASGADVVDLGCVPGRRWDGIGRAVSSLRERGFRVSVDTFDPWEMREGVAAGAEYVLSVTPSTVHLARDLRGATVVVVPDSDPPADPALDGLARAVERLRDWDIPFILDPLLAPINFGFAASLHRYVECRRRFPDAPMMLGAHHLTELLDADSTGVNAVIMGFAQELGIGHILTTEVIPWARGCVRELDRARRLMHFSHRRGVLPKHLDDSLLALKDRRPADYTEDEIRAFHAQVRDPNFRIFTDGLYIYAFNARTFVRGTDPAAIFRELNVSDAGHAFYLGRELERAAIALRLGKRYRQEQPLRFGYLTPGEEGAAAPDDTAPREAAG